MNRFVTTDPSRCIGCNTCMAACAQVHRVAGLQSHPRLTVTRTQQATAPVVCRQCEDAPCARVCPVNAIRHSSGSIDLDEKTCVGCKLCALACPFGAITVDGTSIAGVAGIGDTTPNHAAGMSRVLVWEPGVHSIAVKCDLCAFQPRGPECVRVCPTRALVVMDPKSLTRSADVRRRALVSGQIR